MHFNVSITCSIIFKELSSKRYTHQIKDITCHTDFAFGEKIQSNHSKSRWLQHATGPETIRAAKRDFSHVVSQALVPPAVDEGAEETWYEGKTEKGEEVDVTRRPIGVDQE